MPLNEWVFAPIARAIFSLDPTQSVSQLKTARLSALVRAGRLALLFVYGKHQAAGDEARNYLQTVVIHQPTEALQCLKLWGRDMLLACLDGIECSPRLAGYFTEAAGCGPFAVTDFSAQPDIVINLKRLINGLYHAEMALHLIETCDVESLWPAWEVTCMLLWAYGAGAAAGLTNTSNRVLNCVQQAHLALHWLRQLPWQGLSVLSVIQPRTFAQTVLNRLQALKRLVKLHHPESDSLEAEVLTLRQIVQQVEWHQAPSWSNWPLFISLFVRGHRLASSLFQQTASLSTVSQQQMRELLRAFKYSVVLALLAWVDHAEEEMAIKPGQLASLALEPLTECYGVVQQHVARVINLPPDLTTLRDSGFVNQRVTLRCQRNWVRQSELADPSGATAVFYQGMTDDAIAYDYASANLACPSLAEVWVTQPQMLRSSRQDLASIEQIFTHAVQLLPLLNPCLVLAVTNGQPISLHCLPFSELASPGTVPLEPPPVVSIKAFFNALFHLQQAEGFYQRLTKTQYTLVEQLQDLYRVGMLCDQLRHAGHYLNQCATNLAVRGIWQAGFQLAQAVFDTFQPWARLLKIDNFPDPQPSVADVLQVTHPLFLAFERLKTWPTTLPLSALQVEAVRKAAERVSTDLVSLLAADSAFKFLFALPALYRFYTEVQALLEQFAVFSGTTLQRHLAALHDEKIASVLVKVDHIETLCLLRPGVLSGPIAAVLTRYYRNLLLGLVADSRSYCLLVSSPRVFIQRLQALDRPLSSEQPLSLACLEQQKKVLLASQVQFLQMSNTLVVEFARGVIARELGTVAKAERLVLSKTRYAADLADEINANEAVLLANIQPSLDISAQIKPRLRAAVQQFNSRNLATFNHYEAILTTLQQLRAYLEQQQTYLQSPGGWSVFENQVTLAAKLRLLAQLEACVRLNQSCRACMQQLKQQVSHPEFNKILLASHAHNAFTWAWLIQRLLQLLDAVGLYQPPTKRFSCQFAQRFFSSTPTPPIAKKEPLAPIYSV